MECNKDEALRAKQIAETKMQNGDFAGAQKIARKAQQLYPELENVSQMLTVCEVHCSAQNKILGSEHDWYGILQIERSADEATIKKQYRKLALLLHPDKNKFSGAEAAFKLIGEAHRMLSDQTKRSVYDLKLGATARSSAPRPRPQQAQKSFMKKQHGSVNNFPNGPSQYGAANAVPKTTSQFTGSNPFVNAEKTTFWTSCSSCGIRYQYYRTFVNKILRCQSCQQSFTAYDLGTQGVPPGFCWTQFHNQNGISNPGMQNGFPNPGPSKVPSKNNGGMPSGSNFADKFTRLDSVYNAGNAAQAGGCSKTQEKVYARVDLKEDITRPKPNLASGKEGARIPEPNIGKPSGLKASRNSSKKRKRKSVNESDESCEASTSDELDAEVQENSGKFSGQNFGADAGQQRRKSLRQKQNVSYKDKFNDDDFGSALKKSKGSKPPNSGKEEVQEAVVPDGVSKDDTSARNADGDQKLIRKSSSVEESVPNKKSKTGEYKAEEKKSDISDDDDRKALMPEVIEYPDPDFSDFDKDRAENCFAVNQLWAIYDTCDGMPRFYARIKKVFSPGFKVQITWLEPDPDDEIEIAWSDADLPIACGKYTIGNTEVTEDRLMFSHQISWMKGGGRNCHLVYPKMGETWAIFRNWDIKWSSDPEKYRPPHQFEFVEVLTDFDEKDGIGVAYLSKVKGFVSLFQKTARHGVISFSIKPAELYRFSHQIPSFKMTGKEREGVPVGSFEFDPAALPTNLSELDDLGNVKIENEHLVTEANGPYPKSAEVEVKSVIDSNNLATPKKLENDPEKENIFLGRFPRGSNSERNYNNQVDGSQRTNQENSSEDVTNVIPTQPKGGTKCSTDDRIKTPKKQASDCAMDAMKLRRSPRDLGKKTDQLGASQSTMQQEISKHSDSKVKKQASILQFMGSASSSQSNDKKQLHARDGNSARVMETFNAPTSASMVHTVAEAVCHDFKAERLEDKFQFDQIWAVYGDTDGMPKNYAQVKIIELTADCRFHVVPLEACSPPKDSSQPVCCGTFKVKNGKTKVLPLSAFSHQPKSEALGRNRYAIYPRKGEVWAINKSSASELANLDRHKGDCDIVEIMEENDQSVKVVVLSCIDGSRSLYRVPRNQRSKTGVMEIPRADFTRFSHQIPAFQLAGEKDIQLRDCWSLDPSAIPGTTIIID